MWHTCIAGTSLAALVQTILLADALNDFDTVPGFQADWWWVFSPTILYLAISALYIASFFWRAAHFITKARRAANPGLDEYQAPNAATRAKAIAIDRRNAWISFVDAFFDTALLACGVVFVWRMIHTLEIAQVNDDNTDWSFIGAAIPLVVLWSLLTVVAIIGAWRTSREYGRVQREMTVSSSANGGNDDDEESGSGISYRASAVKEKGDYMANARYQQWPCAFMFTWSLGYGWPDSVLAILLFAMLPAMILVTLLLAEFLNTGAPAMGEIFIVLWILEGLIVVFAIVAGVWMCCCSCMPLAQPRGRAGLMSKNAELFVIIFVAISLAIQQILIAVRVDESDPIDWYAVFIPFYVLFGLVAFASCAAGHCCLAKAGDTVTEDNIKYTQTPQTSAWGLIGESAK